MVAFTVLLFPPKAALSKFIRMDLERWMLVSDPEYNFHELIQFSSGDFCVWHQVDAIGIGVSLIIIIQFV